MTFGSELRGALMAVGILAIFVLAAQKVSDVDGRLARIEAAVTPKHAGTSAQADLFCENRTNKPTRCFDRDGKDMTSRVAPSVGQEAADRAGGDPFGGIYGSYETTGFMPWPTTMKITTVRTRRNDAVDPVGFSPLSMVGKSPF